MPKLTIGQTSSTSIGNVVVTLSKRKKMIAPLKDIVSDAPTVVGMKKS